MNLLRIAVTGALIVGVSRSIERLSRRARLSAGEASTARPRRKSADNETLQREMEADSLKRAESELKSGEIDMLG